MFSGQDYRSICSAVTLQSNKGGFFCTWADNVANTLDERWFGNFGKLKTNKERIMKCFTDKKIRDDIVEFLENIQEIYRGKSAPMARQRKQEADRLYENGKHQRSLQIYTQSIIKAPAHGIDKKYDDGNTLSLALRGRSNVWCEVGEPVNCLEDIKFSLKEKLPENMHLSAYWKMAECYIQMNETKKAKITLKIIEKLIQKGDAVTTSQHKLQLDYKYKEIENKEEMDKSTTNRAECQPTATELASTTSSYLRLTENMECGRYFVSNGKIKTGETLIIEKPYVSCLSPDQYGTHCHHCLSRLKYVVPCMDCSAVAFCSMGCQSKATNTYHKYECRYMDLLIGSGMSILCFAALRIVSQQNFKYFGHIVGIEDIPKEHPYYKVYNLEGHADKRTPKEFFYRTLMALFLLAVLKKAGYFASNKEMDNMTKEELSIACVLLKNLEVLQFNAHEIFETIKNKDGKSKMMNIGIGLYAVASFFNHDCYPAVTRYFKGTQLIVKTIRPVLKNEMVGDNYGAVFFINNLSERRTKLHGRYWFDCKCTACLENWPLSKEIKDSVRIKCSHASNTLSAATTCDQCSISYVNALCETYNCLKGKFDGISQEIIDDKIESELRMLSDLVADIAQPPNILLLNIQKLLSNYWLNDGNTFSI